MSQSVARCCVVLTLRRVGFLGLWGCDGADVFVVTDAAGGVLLFVLTGKGLVVDGSPVCRFLLSAIVRGRAAFETAVFFPKPFCLMLLTLCSAGAQTTLEHG